MIRKRKYVLVDPKIHKDLKRIAVDREKSVAEIVNTVLYEWVVRETKDRDFLSSSK
ncbi:MAG: hypothetical protein QXO76_01990 [Thermoproteota archaeon]